MSDPGLIFSSGSYVATGLAVATAISATIILAIGTLILVRGRESATSTVFFLLTVVTSGWLICFAMMYAAQSAEVALWWARLSRLPMGLLPAASFHFAALQSPGRRLLRVTTRMAWVVGGLLGLIAATTPYFFPGVTVRPWGYYPQQGAAAYALTGFELVLIVPALFLLFRAYSESEGRAQERAAALLLAFLFGSLTFVDLLPALGIEIYPIGYVTTFGAVLVIAAAIWRYQLVDLTPGYAASQILETMKSAVLLVDMAGKIRVVNRGVAALLGYAEADLIGEHMRKILDNDENTSTKRLLNSTGVLEQHMAWRAADGQRIDVLTSSSFVRDAEGEPIGVVYVASDFTERRRAEKALRESENRYRTLFEMNPLPMWVYDLESLKFVAVNEAAVNHYGYTREEFLKMRITDIRPQEDVPQVLALIPLLPERTSTSTFRHMTKEGTIIHVDVSSFEFLLSGRRMRLVIAQDVTERRRAEQLLRESEARYRNLFERNLAGVYRSTEDGRILDCNEAFARIFGYDSREEMVQQSAVSLYFEQADRERILSMLRTEKTLTNLEARMRRKDDSAIWALENMTLLESSDGPGVIEGTIIDITDRKTALEKIEYQAYHDVLTGLPNRLLFRDRIALALAHARRTSCTVAVMFLDVDQFKPVNDTLGHNVGDRLLQAIASRLARCVRSEDTVARMGGDEFTVLLADAGDGRGATKVAKKILEAIQEPVLIDEHELRVTTSIGIALYPGDGFDVEALLRNADAAMYRAKQFGRNNYQYATPPPFDDRQSIESRLRAAIEKNEFVLHYQPIVETATGRLVGAEALLRWNDPARGLLEPISFMEAAEEADLMPSLGEWVLRKASAQMKEWHDQGHTGLRLSVNLSAKQFHRRDLPETVRAILNVSGLRPGALDLEITESTAMLNPELSLAVMRELKAMGVRISIDDFGTGYSSLSYLKRLPIDTVKIDREFVRDLVADADDRAIIAAVVSMARRLDLRVVAEGVETSEQLEFLRSENCTEIQGYVHSRPVAAADFERTILVVSTPGAASRPQQPATG